MEGVKSQTTDYIREGSHCKGKSKPSDEYVIDPRKNVKVSAYTTRSHEAMTELL